MKADLRCQRLVDVSWSGVPIPHQQFVNVYHILYKEEEDVNAIPDSVFKVAKIDSMRATRIGYLRPGTRLDMFSFKKSHIQIIKIRTYWYVNYFFYYRYSMWLEAYLSNGKIMKSNVETVQTKMSDEPQSTGKFYLISFFSRGMKIKCYERLNLLNLLEFLSSNRVQTL